MVKSRGYRIEFRESESALYKIDAVISAADIPLPDETIGNRLIACVALDKEVDHAYTDNEILALLSKRLPA